MNGRWVAGNAAADGAAHRGWFVGHFLEYARHGPRATSAVEIKWGTHPAGDARAEWAPGDERSTLTGLVSGRFRVDIPGEQVVMADPGDYVIFGPGVAHSWEALANSVVITVRWPSYSVK